ncbi:MAG: phosphate ABC transporter permease PstA [Candidatus Acetothermia bacterium]
MVFGSDRILKNGLMAIWFSLSGLFLALSGALATRPGIIPSEALVVFGVAVIGAVGLTFLSFILLEDYQPPLVHFAISSLILIIGGSLYTFFPDRGLVLPGLEGDITPMLANISISLILTFASIWAGLLFIRENPAQNKQNAVKYFTWISVLIPLGALVFFLVYTIRAGYPAINWHFISSGTDTMRGKVGIFPAIAGTFSLIIGATVLAVPLGVGAAVFLTEYAKRGWIKQIVGVTADCLWSTPSIVFGLFGFVFLVPRITGHSTLLAGQIILAAMLLPLTVATSTEALSSVPDEFRHGSLALGASRWWTIRKVVLPSSVPSIVTGILLGIGRIAGETAPIMLIAVASNTDPPRFFTSAPPYFNVVALFQEVDALPYRLYSIYKAGVGGSIQEAWGTAMVLIVVVLLFYALGIIVRSYYRRERGW